MKKHIVAALVCLALSLRRSRCTRHRNTAGIGGRRGTDLQRKRTNELTVPSTMLELEIPAGMHVMQIATSDGFTFDVKKDGNQIVSITWKKEIKPKERASFYLTAHNPQPGALQWKAHQTFADDSMKHWIGERGTKEPASVTTIVPKGEATKAAPAADPAHKHP